MSFNGTIKRFLPVLFFLSAGIASSTAIAQTSGTGGDAITDDPKIMLIACDGGRAMISADGGTSWKILDAVAAEQARQELLSPTLKRRIAADQASSRTAMAAPNPTPGRTEIRYAIEEADAVTITLHSATGAEVLRVDDNPRGSGAHATTIDASGVPSGSYFFRVRNSAGRVIGEGSLGIAR